MIFATGLSEPEAPAFLSDGTLLVVEMGSTRGCITRLSRDGRERRVVAHTGRPNGLAVDRLGTIWVAESHEPALLRVSIDGAIERVVDHCDGEAFLFPNDLCFGPDGYLYVTDSGIPFADLAPSGRVRSDYRSAAIDGRVYRVDPQTFKTDLVDSGLRLANGLAFAPDGSLYVAETITGAIYRYGHTSVGAGTSRHLIANVLTGAPTTGFSGPDGMAFDAAGYLYVTVLGVGEVCVLDQAGTVVTRFPTVGAMPTNVAFGPPGERRIYVTEDQIGQVEIYDVARPGLTLHQGAVGRETVTSEASRRCA